MKRSLASATAVLAAVTAAGAAAAPRAEDVPTRDCASRAEPSRGILAFTPDDVVAGPVAFTSMRSADPRAIAAHDGFYSRKVGLKVRAGPAVTVVVPGPLRARLWLAYTRGSFDDPSIRRSAVRFVPCPPRMRAFRGGTVGAVTGFNGGIVFARKGCYPVEVHVAGRERPYRVRLSLGSRCS